MALNSTPSSTARHPIVLPQDPPSVKSKKEAMAQSKSEKVAESNKYHKKIKSEAMAQVQVWNWKASQETPSS